MDVKTKRMQDRMGRTHSPRSTATAQSQARDTALDKLDDVALHPSIERALDAAREILGLELAYLTRHTDTEQVLEVLSGDGESFGVAAATRFPLEVTYCQRILSGELPAVIADVQAHPVAGEMPISEAADVGAFASVPLELSDGRLYGTLCAASHAAQPDLTDRDIRYLHLLARIVIDQLEREQLLREQASLRLESTGVEALLAAVQARDGYTAEHSHAVVEHAVAVARRLGLDDREVLDVRHVSLLHDVGKLGTPDHVLHKPGPLDEGEWVLMREHPVVGGQVVAALPGLERLAGAVRAEHERWDGGGYPDGLAGEEIPIASRITLACDAYHAMTSNRPYRAAMSHEAAVAELRIHAGSQFCGRCVEALIAVLDG